jgi:hypothetical protein
MDTLDNNVMSAELSINSKINKFLLETAKWTKFLAIVGFVFIGLIVLGALTAIVSGVSLYRVSGISGGPFVLGFTYLLMALLYYFPTRYLYNFAVKMKMAIQNSQQNNLEDGFENLKSLFKFSGIFMIVILSIYGLVFLIGLIGLAAM